MRNDVVYMSYYVVLCIYLCRLASLDEDVLEALMLVKVVIFTYFSFVGCLEALVSNNVALYVCSVCPVFIW